MRDKGISTLIASVLILAIVLTVGLLASGFFRNIISDTTDSARNTTQNVYASSEYGLDVEDAVYSTVDDTLDITIRNTGKNYSGNYTVTSFCKSGTPVQKEFSGLKEAETVRKSISVPGCSVNRVTVSLQNYPVEAEKEKIQKVNFATWSQSTASEFENIALSYSNVFFASVQLSQTQKSSTETSSFSGKKQNLTEQSGTLKLETP